MNKFCSYSHGLSDHPELPRDNLCCKAYILIVDELDCKLFDKMRFFKLSCLLKQKYRCNGTQEEVVQGKTATYLGSFHVLQ